MYFIVFTANIQFTVIKIFSFNILFANIFRIKFFLLLCSNLFSRKMCIPICNIIYIYIYTRLALPVAIWAIGHMALDLGKQRLLI